MAVAFAYREPQPAYRTERAFCMSFDRRTVPRVLRTAQIRLESCVVPARRVEKSAAGCSMCSRDGASYQTVGHMPFRGVDDESCGQRRLRQMESRLRGPGPANATGLEKRPTSISSFCVPCGMNRQRRLRRQRYEHRATEQRSKRRPSAAGCEGTERDAPSVVLEIEELADRQRDHRVDRAVARVLSMGRPRCANS
jgi:hypothetical protein